MRHRCNGCGMLYNGGVCGICASAADFEADEEEAAPLGFTPHPQAYLREPINWTVFAKLWLLFMVGVAFGLWLALVIMPTYMPKR